MGTNLLDDGLSLMESGEPIKALDRFNLFIKENPYHPEALCARGICYLRIGEEKKGKSDILLADSLGSAAASEFIDANNIQRKFNNAINYSGVKGWLKFYCITNGFVGVIGTLGGVVNRDFIQAFFCLWQFLTAYHLYNRAWKCVLNAKIFHSTLCILYLLLIIMILRSSYQGLTDFITYFIYSLCWLVYFLRSERVRATYHTE